MSLLPKLLVFSGLGCFTACNFRNNLFAVQSKHLKFSVKLDMLSDFRHGGKFSVLSSCFSDTVFVTLLCTAVETAISKVRKLLGTGGVPASLTLLFWQWLTVSLVFASQSAWMSYSSLSSSLISLLVSVNVEHHERWSNSSWVGAGEEVSVNGSYTIRLVMFLAIMFAIVEGKTAAQARNTVSVQDDVSDLYLYFDVTLHWTGCTELVSKEVKCKYWDIHIIDCFDLVVCVCCWLCRVQNYEQIF